MKRRIIFALAIMMLLMTYMDYNSTLIIREATGATYTQGNLIKSWLGAKDIECLSITDSTSPFIKGMSSDLKAFDIIGKDQKTYLLILENESNKFIAVLDSNGELLHGIIEGNMLPAFSFE